jgi:quinol monooxygenase YgiN
MSTSTTMPSKKQLTLFVDFYVQVSKIEDWKAAHRPVWVACGNEPECLLFDVFHDPADPGHFRLVEVWDADREWFESKQLTKPYYAELWDKSRPTWEKEVVINYFEREGEGCSFRKGYMAGGKSMD